MQQRLQLHAVTNTYWMGRICAKVVHVLCTSHSLSISLTQSLIIYYNTHTLTHSHPHTPTHSNTHSSLVEMTRESTECCSSVKKRRTSRDSSPAPRLASCSTIICSSGEPTTLLPQSMSAGRRVKRLKQRYTMYMVLDLIQLQIIFTGM